MKPAAVDFEQRCEAGRSALVVIDMLNDFLHPDGKTALDGGRDLTAGRAVIGLIDRLIGGARAGGVPVFYVQHSTLPNQASHSGPWLDARSRASYSSPDIATEGSWGQQIVDELAPQESDVIIKKHRYSGFAGTRLDELLRAGGRDTIILCGVSTNVCVESTARQGFDLDYYVLLPEDACGSWSNELHEASLETARNRYAIVCTSADVSSVWEGAGK